MNLQKTPIAFAFALISAAPFVAQAAPTVSFKTPAAGATISQPISQSSACEVTGTNIKRVVFSVVSSTGSTTSLNTEGSAPWNCNIDPRNFQSGQYTLRAVAYDSTSGGASSTATRSVTLQNGTTSGTTTPPTTGSGPTVSFKTPSEGAAITKAISQSSACEVVGSGITKVQFFLGATALNTEGSSPWNCNIDPAKFAPGTYPLKAVAYNSSGASSSAQINVTIGSGTTTGGGTTTNTAPAVSVTSPGNGATVSGTAVSCAANATDSNGITQVVFSLDGTPLSTDTSSPYTCGFDSTKLANGSHTLKAEATDALGATNSTQVSFNVSNGTTSGGTSSPSPSSGLSFKAPTDGQTISGNFNQSSTCEVTPSGISVNSVKFFLNTTALNTEGSAPWQCNLDTRKFADGVYTLKAQALNSSGSTTGTTQISVRIQNGTTSGGTSNPTPSSGLSFKAPTDGQTISGNLNQSSACEVAPSGISVKSVKFFLDTTALNTEGSAPWQCNLDTRKFADGVYTLKAQALNSSGSTTGTTQISVRIQNGTTSTTNTAPTVSLTAPVVGATLSGTAASYAASASDTGGSVAKVDFYLVNASGGQTLVGTDTTNDYAGSFDTTKFANGTYTLMAVATDNLGANASTQRSVSISNTSSGSDAGGGTSGTSAIAASDIITRASADVPFAQQSGYNIQVINKYTSVPNIPESGIHGTTLPNGETLRFGKVADPMDSIRKALAFQVHTSDPITSSGKRSELSITPNIEMNKVYWIAFSVFVYDWGTLSTNDNALFGTQMHTGDNDAKVGGPSFGIYTAPGGRKFFVKTRYSESSAPSDGNSVSIKHAQYDIPFGRWADFVIKFKHNTSGNGFLQAWMDGQLITNYTGSLGYSTGMADYAKFGYYNWSGTGMGPTARKVLLRSPTIVADPTGSKYSQEQLRTLVGAGAAQ